MSDSTSNQPELHLPPENAATAAQEVGARADTVWTRGPDAAPAVASLVGKELRGAGGRVAIVDGCRTPFARSGTDLRDMDVVDLASVAASELVQRNAIDPAEIGLSVFGCVVPALNAPNLGREVVFRAGLPDGIPGTTVNLACASSNRAITSGAEAILTGQCEVVLAGGAESLTNVPIQYSKGAARKLVALSKARTLGQRLGVIAKVRPRDLVPVPPAIAEYTTGKSMGQSAEQMAQENDISRRAQDEIALMSHQRAAAAAAEGRFDGQIALTFPRPGYDKAIASDNGVRSDTLPRGAGRSPAGLRQAVRNDHRRQREPADRRRLGGAADERREGQGARLRAARLHPLVGLRVARPGRPAPAGPRLRGAGGSRRCRA